MRVATGRPEIILMSDMVQTLSIMPERANSSWRRGIMFWVSIQITRFG
jgi:hypothetical protein